MGEPVPRVTTPTLVAGQNLVGRSIVLYVQQDLPILSS